MKHSWRAACWTLLLSAANAGFSQTAQPDAMPTPSGLPPAADIARALQNAPRLLLALESVARGQSLERRYRAGPHELEINALSQRRTDAAGRTGNEMEYGVQSGLRWPWKRALDQQIGGLAREIGELSYIDAWHEAGRLLLDQWYAWLQAEHTARLHDAQLQILLQQQAAVAKRVDAGDAARLELQIAEAQTQQMRATRAQAQRDARLARELLARDFPDLSLNLQSALSAPDELSGPDEPWLDEIITHNHEIELANTRRDEAELTAERAQRDRLADPTVGLRYSNNLGGERRVIGLTFSMPVGTAARSASVAMARSDARIASAEARLVEDAVRAAARSAVTDARYSYRNWQESQAAQRQLQAAADASARGYSLGEFDLSVMLSARRAYQQQSAGRQTIETPSSPARCTMPG
ncbi:MAG: TolC family protein [Steroidobacteraceae bacterium]